MEKVLKIIVALLVIARILVGCKKSDNKIAPDTNSYSTGATVDKAGSNKIKVTSTTKKSPTDRYLDITVGILPGNIDTSYAYDQIVLFCGSTRVMDRDVLERRIGEVEKVKSKNFSLSSEYTLFYIRGYTTTAVADTLLTLSGN